ncbi:hypothetical protein ACFQNF_19720 [Iodobacter arcticus]|uniref:Bacteriophage-related protein n=1 Tax=Iodobacter arcticus TaxID=590593 RepID=A0ABW2R6L7_9NEIS
MPNKQTLLLNGEPVHSYQASPAGPVLLTTFIPFKLIKRGMKKEIITPIDAPEQFMAEAAEERQARKAAENTPLIRALGRAFYWQKLLDSNKVKTPAEIAKLEALDVSYVRRLLRLTLLAPSILEMILGGEQRHINLAFILRQKISMDWQEQEALFIKHL